MTQIHHIGGLNVIKKQKKKSYDLKKRYSSGVRLLLYLVKNSLTKFSKAVCEIYKFMDKANISHHKALLRATKYIIYTKYDCYQMKPYRNTNGLWGLRGYSDTDYTVDNDTCKSVTGNIVLINEAVIAWNLLSQKTVTLSVT